jgi:hypothetical protein
MKRSVKTWRTIDLQQYAVIRKRIEVVVAINGYGDPSSPPVKICHCSDATACCCAGTTLRVDRGSTSGAWPTGSGSLPDELAVWVRLGPVDHSYKLLNKHCRLIRSDRADERANVSSCLPDDVAAS